MRVNRKLRGFLLHDERICFDNLAPNDADPENSSYSQTAGRPGTAIAVDTLGTLRPRAHHAQEQDLTVVAIRPGLPATDTGVGLGYRVLGEDDSDTRGWTEPNNVQGYAPVEWSTTSNWLDVDSVTCPRSQRIVAVARESAGAEDPSAWVWNPSSRNWVAIGPIGAGVMVSDRIAILVLRSGRLLATDLRVVFYSDDDGETWAEHGGLTVVGLGVSFSSSITHARWIEDGHSNIMILAVDEVTGDAWQFASFDEGMTYQEVDSATAWGTVPTLTLTATGRIGVAYRDFSSGGKAAWITLDDAYDQFSLKAFVELNGATGTESLACVTDADGVIYVVISPASSDFVSVTRSLDHGGTFELYTFDAIATGGDISGPTDHRHHVRSVSASGGELVALFNSKHSVNPNTDGSIVSVVLGGWSNIEAPSGSLFTAFRGFRQGSANSSDQDLTGIFLPTAKLADQGWTGSGTAETLVGGYHQFAGVGASSFASLTFTGTAGPTGRTPILFEAQVVAGGSAASDQVVLSYLRRDGANRRALTIRLHEAGFLVRDDDSGSPSTLATVVVDMTATVYQFLMVWGETRVTVYYRPRADTLWIRAFGPALLAETADATGRDSVIVGVPSVTTATVRVGLVGWQNIDPEADVLASLETLAVTDRLRWGKATGTRPYPVRDQVDVDGNMLHLSASGGVARLFERWQIAAEWDRGVRELHPVESPKPTAGWRSLDTAEQTLTWDLGIDSRLGHSWALGAALIRANFHQALIEASTDAAPSTWFQLGAYVGFVATSVLYTRSGDLIFPAAGTPPGAMFWGAGALKGGQAILDPLNVPACCRRIAWNQGGGWVERGVQAVLRIEGLDGTEPTSGTMHIVAPSAVLVMHTSSPMAYRRIRLRIPEQETPDGHFRLGKLVLGSIIPIGRQYSRGWSVRHVPITRIEEDDDGTVFVDPRGSEVSGSYRREITTSYQDGYDDSDLRAGLASYLSATAGTPPLVSELDVRAQIEGFLRASRGGSVPSVALPEIPAVSGPIFDRDMFSFGRLGAGQAWQVNNVQGDEGRSEVYRGEGLTHVELV